MILNEIEGLPRETLWVLYSKCSDLRHEAHVIAKALRGAGSSGLLRTTAWMQEVEQRMEQLPRFIPTVGAFRRRKTWIFWVQDMSL